MAGRQPWQRTINTNGGKVKLAAALGTADISTTSIAAAVPQANAYAVESNAVQRNQAEHVAIPASMPGSTNRANPTSSAQIGLSSEDLGISVQRTQVAGAAIARLAPGGVAEQSGLHVGDVVTSVDGIRVGSPEELAAELSRRSVGTKIRLGYVFQTSALGLMTKGSSAITPDSPISD
jgi:putative serine protease PepD